MSTLSVAMIVKNEEQFIEKVLLNIQPVADEIVITDTGSTDKTLDIFKKFKLRLFHYKWNGSDARARNFTLSKCKTDWILFIDADEFIDINCYKEIRKLISRKNRYIAYRILLRNYHDHSINLENLYQQDLVGSYTLNSLIRIFKNRERVFYSRPAYPSVAESFRGRQNLVGNSNVVFHHLDILRNRDKRREKIKWYHTDVFKNLKRYPDNLDVNYGVAHYYLLRGKFHKAIYYYKKILKVKSTYIKAKLSLGLSYVMLGKEEKGMEIINACGEDNNAYSWEVESYLNTAYKIIAARMLEKKKGHKSKDRSRE